MGRYLNPRNTVFKEKLASEIYIDKSKLIDELNKHVCRDKKFIANTRPRRFGKSMNLQMIAAYYNLAQDSHALFEGSEISKCKSYETYINKFDVLWLDILCLIDRKKKTEQLHLIEKMEQLIVEDIKESYGQYIQEDSTSVMAVLDDINRATGKQFVILMDEWDAIFRLYKGDTALHKEYINFLRSLFKGSAADEVVALAYITGILPIKKYGTESALNNFSEYTMLDADFMSPYVGFTEKEVKDLCTDYHVDFDQVQSWYNGYYLNGIAVYNPNSVVNACSRGRCKNYWTQTETFESLRDYILMDFDHLYDKVLTLFSGAHLYVETDTFTNSLLDIRSEDDVLTLLVHLGYLAYDEDAQEVFIPNKEVMDRFKSAIKMAWSKVKEALDESRALLSATLSMDAETVADILEKAHEGTCSMIKYNDENSLACALSIAYYSARDEYLMTRELATGKGFADIVLLPRKNVNKPAIIVELKYKKSAQGAIEQIKKRNDPAFVAQYTGEILLVEVNYESDSKSENYKKHSCVIEKYNLD